MHSLMRRVAAVALAGFGLIHLYQAPGDYDEHRWLGIGFVLGGLFALGAAVLLLARSADRLWASAAAVSGAFFVGFLLTRTIGLFGVSEPGNWERLGIVSLLFEASVIALYAIGRRTAGGAETGYREVMARSRAEVSVS